MTTVLALVLALYLLDDLLRLAIDAPGWLWKMFALLLGVAATVTLYGLTFRSVVLGTGAAGAASLVRHLADYLIVKTDAAKWGLRGR